MLRSCYRTKCRFFRDSDIETDIIWYFCLPGAPALPFYTRFGSGNWASEKQDWTGPGEVSGRPREWSNGKPPAGADRFKPWGTADNFANGCLINDAVIGKRPIDQLPPVGGWETEVPQIDDLPRPVAAKKYRFTRTWYDPTTIPPTVLEVLQWVVAFNLERSIAESQYTWDDANFGQLMTPQEPLLVGPSGLTLTVAPGQFELVLHMGPHASVFPLLDGNPIAGNAGCDPELLFPDGWDERGPGATLFIYLLEPLKS